MPDNKLSNKIWNGNGIVNAIPFFYMSIEFLY